MNRKMGFLTFVACGCAVSLIASQAVADDASWSGGLALGDVQLVEHADAAPWAGWVNVSVMNTGTDPWGDFHFNIYDPMGTQDISHVDWVVDVPFQPISTQSPLTWSVDNDMIGASLDLFFYDDPILPGETAEFHVYNVNPDHVSFFGVSFYPTPVPEPTTLTLLALGALGLLRRRS